MLFVCCPNLILGQAWLLPVHQSPPDFKQAQNTFNAYWDNQAYQKHKGYKQFKRWEHFMCHRMDKHNQFKPTAAWQAIQHLHKQQTEITAKSGLPLANWTFGGPFSIPNAGTQAGGMGRANFITFHPNDPDQIYIGTPSGGLWYTTTENLDWQTDTDLLPVLGSSDLLIHPNNPDIMYLATGDGDGGHTYCNGVLKSVDGGQNWAITGLSPENGGPNYINKLAMNPENPNTLLAASGLAIYRSLNAGENWQQVSGTGWFKDMQYKIGDTSVIYATGYKLTGDYFAKFYRSTDGGRTWIQRGTGLPENIMGRLAIGLSPEDPNRIYLVATDFYTGTFHGFYRSDDGGSNFYLVSNTPDIITGQGYYNLAIAVAPNDPDEIYVAGISLFKSIDGGLNWTEQIGPRGNSNYMHVDIHELAFDPHNSNALYAATDGGVFKTIDGGNTWEDQSASLYITQYYDLAIAQDSSGFLIGGTQDNGLIIQNEGDWGNFLAMDVTNAAISRESHDSLFVVNQDGEVWKTTPYGFLRVLSNLDNGVWEQPAWRAPLVLHPQIDTTIYVGYQSIWRSQDRGKTWDNYSGLLSSEGPLLDMAFAPSDPDLVAYATNGLYMYYSHEGTNNWQQIEIDASQGYYNSIAVHDANPMQVWVCNSEGQVLESTDGGQSWIDISEGLPNIAANKIIYHSGIQAGLYVGMDVGIFYRDLASTEWLPFTQDLPNVIINDLVVNKKTNQLFAATFGRGIWQTPLVETQDSMATHPEDGLRIQLKVILEGAYLVNEDAMRTTLYENNLLPFQQTYTVAPYYYEGTEDISTLNNLAENIVDWILIELRDPIDPNILLEQQAALLLSDGTLMDANGQAGILLENLEVNESAHIVVRHRNHLDIISADPIVLDNDLFLDFSTDSNTTFGNSQKQINDIYTMYAGDINGDGVITVRDFNTYLSQASQINQYLEADCNLDRAVTVTDMNLYRPNTSKIGVAYIRL